VLLAIWLAKILIIAGKGLGRSGSTTPGAVALRICPDILRILGSQVAQTVVVCGTNGKTTTNNLIYSALAREGIVVCNNVGANMMNGIVCAYTKSAGFWGGMKAKYATIEIDELSARHVFEHIKPRFMIITNLSRDQLDRYGEIDIALTALQEAIDKVPNCELILNGDDPLVSGIDVANRKHFFTSDITNINAATALCNLLEVPADFRGYKPQAGRMESFNIKGNEFILNLAKNPASFDVAIREVLQDERKKCIVLVINDNEQDGIDISWLWDVNFERLSEVEGIIPCGTRRDDLAVRLKYAECKMIFKASSVNEGIMEAIGREKAVTYVMVNYTALFGTRKILRKLARRKYYRD
jgi:UDP-N-acetylmuramyl tripeptide synthase